MKRFGIVLFVLFSFTTICAQANKDYDGVKPEVYPGSKSLVFTYTPFQSDLGGVPTSSLIIGSEDEFEQVNLIGLGFKIFVSNKFSLLASLGYGLGSSTQEATPLLTTKTEATTFVYGGAVAANFHLASLYSITPYVGGSINVGLLSADIDVSGSEISKTEYSSTSFGAGGHFGFDWFFTEGISLGGKFTLGFQTSSKPEKTVTIEGSSTTTKGPSLTTFGTGVGTIILNVHF